MDTAAEVNRAAPEAKYTCPGSVVRVLVRLEAAAVVKALPAVVGKVTWVFRVMVVTCTETDMSLPVSNQIVASNEGQTVCLLNRLEE